LPMTRRGYVCLITAVLTIVGCKPNPNQGFYVGTYEALGNPNPGGPPGPLLPLVGTTVSGQWVGNNGGSPGGSETVYWGKTGAAVNDPDVLGVYYVSNGIAPAYWDHEVWFPSICNNPLPPAYLKSSSVLPPENEFETDAYWTENNGTSGPPPISWACIVPPGATLPASPSFAFAGGIPSTVTVPAMNPFSSQYGMPEMYVFSGANGTPSFYDLIPASSVGPSGSSATFPLPAPCPRAPIHLRP
jgi:hypothetical protein